MSIAVIESPSDVVRALLAGRGAVPVRAAGQAFAPANIALCKYWGKRQARLNLPRTSSLSMSLGSLGSEVRLCRAEGRTDTVMLNGAPLAADSAFVTRLRDYLDLFRPTPDWAFAVTARNTVPTAAGFASSASGFAALVLALDDYFGWALPRRDLSILARLGSGSACRSVYDGFVEWHAGVASDGMDSWAEPVAAIWPDLRMALLVVSAAEKGTSSRIAMQRTVETSPLYAGWPRQVEEDLAAIKSALVARDLEALGAVVERNALAMHATMMAARPPVLYWLPQSVALMRRVWDLRAHGLPVFFTMDAGPNVKVLYAAPDEAAVLGAFSDLTVIRPEPGAA